MSYRITVTKCEPNQDASTPGLGSCTVGPPVETEVFRQTLDELNLSKFVLALNKQPRVRKARVAKSA